MDAHETGRPAEVIGFQPIMRRWPSWASWVSSTVGNVSFQTWYVWTMSRRRSAAADAAPTAEINDWSPGSSASPHHRPHVGTLGATTRQTGGGGAAAAAGAKNRPPADRRRKQAPKNLGAATLTSLRTIIGGDANTVGQRCSVTLTQAITNRRPSTAAAAGRATRRHPVVVRLANRNAERWWATTIR